MSQEKQYKIKEYWAEENENGTRDIHIITDENKHIVCKNCWPKSLHYDFSNNNDSGQDFVIISYNTKN